MAFISYDETGFAQMPSARTYLQAVQRVVRATGHAAPTNLGDGSPEYVLRAMTAVNDAYERVWNAARWQFRIRFTWLQLEDRVVWYRLPADWAGLASDVIQFSGIFYGGDGIRHYTPGPLRHVMFEELADAVPNLRISPQSQTVPTPTQTAIKNAVLEEHAGAPEVFCITGNHMMVWPPPVAGDPKMPVDWSFDPLLLVRYVKAFIPLSANDDEILLTQELLGPLHWLALGYYKQ